MATLETQYKNYLLKNPEPKLSFEEWQAKLGRSIREGLEKINNMKTKIISISQDEVMFDNGLSLSSEHGSECCEHHFLSFSDIEKEDWKDLEFDLSGDDFFTRIPDYGISLNATNNFPLRIPGYGYNNGYYSANLALVLKGNGINRTYDITECQDINDG